MWSYHEIVAGSTRGRAPIRRRQFEAFEFECRGDGATRQSPAADSLRRLPAGGRHDDMGRLASREIRTEMPRLRLVTIGGQGHDQRVAGGEMPDLGGIDAMPGRDLTSLKEKMDTGQGAAAAMIRRIAKSLGVMTTLRMRLHAEMIDDPCRGHRHGGITTSDLSFQPSDSLFMFLPLIILAFEAMTIQPLKDARPAPQSLVHLLCSQQTATGPALDRRTEGFGLQKGVQI